MKPGNLLYITATISVALIIAYVTINRDSVPPVVEPAIEIPAAAIDAVIEQEATLAKTKANAETAGVDADERTQSLERPHTDKFQDQFPDPKAELRRLGMDTSDFGIRDTLSNKTNTSGARYWSAMALGKSKSADAGQILTEILKYDEDHGTRLGAIGGLAYLGDSESISILENYLNHDPNDSIRMGVVSALYRNNSDIGREVLSKVVVDQTQRLSVREQALEFLALTGTPKIANTMRVLLVDELPELRARAAVALANDHRDEALPYLVSAALDDDLSLGAWGAVLRQLQAITGDRFTKVKPLDYFSGPGPRSATNREIESWWESISGPTQ